MPWVIFWIVTYLYFGFWWAHIMTHLGAVKRAHWPLGFIIHMVLWPLVLLILGDAMSSFNLEHDDDDN